MERLWLLNDFSSGGLAQRNRLSCGSEVNLFPVFVFDIHTHSYLYIRV